MYLVDRRRRGTGGVAVALAVLLAAVTACGDWQATAGAMRSADPTAEDLLRAAAESDESFAFTFTLTDAPQSPEGPGGPVIGSGERFAGKEPSTRMSYTLGEANVEALYDPRGMWLRAGPEAKAFEYLGPAEVDYFRIPTDDAVLKQATIVGQEQIEGKTVVRVTVPGAHFGPLGAKQPTGPVRTGSTEYWIDPKVASLRRVLLRSEGMVAILTRGPAGPTPPAPPTAPPGSTTPPPSCPDYGRTSYHDWGYHHFINACDVPTVAKALTDIADGVGAIATLCGALGATAAVICRVVAAIAGFALKAIARSLTDVNRECGERGAYFYLAVYVWPNVHRVC